RDERRPASYVLRRGRAARMGGEEGAGLSRALKRPREARRDVGARDQHGGVGHRLAPRPAVPPREAGSGRRGRGSAIPLPVVGGAGGSRPIRSGSTPRGGARGESGGRRLPAGGRDRSAVPRARSDKGARVPTLLPEPVGVGAGAV